MAQRVYTEEDRREAVDLYIRYGPAEAGRTLGIPESTVRGWAMDADAEMKNPADSQAVKLSWDRRRALAANLMGDEVLRLMNVLHDHSAEELAGERPKDVAIILGILADKAQALTGGKTGNEVEVQVHLGWKQDDL